MKPNAPMSQPALQGLGVHVLAALAAAKFRDERVGLDDLVAAVKARRADVRRAVSALHRAGLVDALRLRLTFAGVAIGCAAAGAKLRPLRSPARAESAAA